MLPQKFKNSWQAFESIFWAEGVKGFYKGYFSYILAMSLWILTVPYITNYLVYEAPWQPWEETSNLVSQAQDEEYEEYFLDDDEE